MCNDGSTFQSMYPTSSVYSFTREYCCMKCSRVPINFGGVWLGLLVVASKSTSKCTC